MPLRVLLADDHQVVRDGLRALLRAAGFEVLSEATNGQEAVKLAEAGNPDVALLDVGMPLLNGIDAAREIVRLCPRTRVILLTMHTEDHHVVAALRAGVHGYVVKTQAADDLVQAIREVLRGAIYLSPSVSRVLAEGKSSKEVAALLGVTTKTAESYRTRIMEKLDIHDTATLVRYAIRHGLIE